MPYIVQGEGRLNLMSDKIFQVRGISAPGLQDGVVELEAEGVVGLGSHVGDAAPVKGLARDVRVHVVERGIVRSHHRHRSTTHRHEVGPAGRDHGLHVEEEVSHGGFVGKEAEDHRGVAHEPHADDPVGRGVLQVEGERQVLATSPIRTIGQEEHHEEGHNDGCADNQSDEVDGADEADSLLAFSVAAAQIARADVKSPERFLHPPLHAVKSEIDIDVLNAQIADPPASIASSLARHLCRHSHFCGEGLDGGVEQVDGAHLHREEVHPNRPPHGEKILQLAAHASLKRENKP
mmetsp:Transcript_15567/g.33826  ORF Transcript_15567/g.33826 Transcript_15567/m.33826 type:complete len:292 (+) Transcript_15567:537-1412(+)